MLTRLRHAAFALAAAAGLVAADARASLTPIFSPGELIVSGTVTWPGADLDVLSNPFLADVTGTGGLQVFVSAPDALLFRRNTSSSWTGSAIPAATDLVWADGATGPVMLSFGSNIQGIGFYVEAELVANTTFTVEAFDDGFQSLGAVQQFSALGGGLFMGVLSDAQNIRVVTVTSSFDPDLVLSGPVVQVPEPSMLWLVITGVAAIAGHRWNSCRPGTGVVTGPTGTAS